MDPNRTNSNTQILQELEALSETLYQSHTSSNRRTASLVLPRAAIPAILAADEPEKDEIALNPKPRSRRMSLSPWRSRPKQETLLKEEPIITKASSATKKWVPDEPVSEKKGFLSWKPIRALAHISMQKLSCLFSIEVVTVQSLPPSMNGLRLSVCVRKKETKDGVVQTMPSRVNQGAADFEETLFIRCHVYYTPGSGGARMKFEPRPFLVYVVAVDAEELDFGRSSVDLSSLIQESIEKNVEGTRIRQWDTSFGLSGKAKGGELVLKLGFQIMEKDGGVGIYSQTGKSKSNSPSNMARKQSKTSFSVPSPRMTSRAEAWTPSQTRASDFQEIDDLNLDEPAHHEVASGSKKAEEVAEAKMDDGDLLDFDVVDKGVENIQDDDKDDKNEDEDQEEEEQSEISSDKRSVTSEVVKEVVQDQTYLKKRLTELDAIAQQIKALESMMGEEKTVLKDEETASQTLDADEDKVTREFLQMLESDGEDDNKLKISDKEIPQSKHESQEENEEEEEFDVFAPDLGKGLGSVVQTRNGGYLASTNPLDNVVSRKDTPKLAMQMSKPLIIQSNTSGFELFQQMAGLGLDELTSEIQSLMPMDELVGKTAEQIAFEGIASAIIQGRDNKEGATSSAARTIATVKSMANAMNGGRKERVSSGIWNVSEQPLTVDEILAFSMQKIESMAVDALKIQAGMAEEDAPFDVSPLEGKTVISSGRTIEDWMKLALDGDLEYNQENAIIVCVVVQLRDPMRQYEAVGGPVIVVIHAMGNEGGYNEERRYKVGSLQVGGVKVKSSGVKSVWDGEKQRLTALQWLVANGMGKAGKKGKRVFTKGPDLLWSISSRVMADMWLKPIRNPDVKLSK